MRLRSKLAGCADLREVREAFSSRAGSRDEKTFRHIPFFFSSQSQLNPGVWSTLLGKRQR
jgi:hypothetical protein